MSNYIFNIVSLLGGLALFRLLLLGEGFLHA